MVTKRNEEMRSPGDALFTFVYSPNSLGFWTYRASLVLENGKKKSDKPQTPVAVLINDLGWVSNLSTFIFEWQC